MRERWVAVVVSVLALGAMACGDDGAATADAGVADGGVDAAVPPDSWAPGVDGAVGADAAEGDAGAATDGGVAVNPATFAEVRAGGQHTCLRRAGGEVVCWGDDGEAQIGDATTAGDPRPPTIVPGVDHAVGLDVGMYHSLVVLEDGRTI